MAYFAYYYYYSITSAVIGVLWCIIVLIFLYFIIQVIRINVVLLLLYYCALFYHCVTSVTLVYVCIPISVAVYLRVYVVRPHCIFTHTHTFYTRGCILPGSIRFHTTGRYVTPVCLTHARSFYTLRTVYVTFYDLPRVYVALIPHVYVRYVVLLLRWVTVCSTFVCHVGKVLHSHSIVPTPFVVAPFTLYIPHFLPHAHLASLTLTHTTHTYVVTHTFCSSHTIYTFTTDSQLLHAYSSVRLLLCLHYHLPYRHILLFWNFAATASATRLHYVLLPPQFAHARSRTMCGHHARYLRYLRYPHRTRCHWFYPPYLPPLVLRLVTHHVAARYAHTFLLHVTLVCGCCRTPFTSPRLLRSRPATRYTPHGYGCTLFCSSLLPVYVTTHLQLVAVGFCVATYAAAPLVRSFCTRTTFFRLLRLPRFDHAPFCHVTLLLFVGNLFIYSLYCIIYCNIVIVYCICIVSHCDPVVIIVLLVVVVIDLTLHLPLRCCSFTCCCVILLFNDMLLTILRYRK